MRIHRIIPAAVLAVLAACGGGGASDADAGLPTIRVAPSPVSGIAGGSVTFSVQASGASLSYQWQFSIDAGTTWTDIAGATAAQYVLDSARFAQSGWLYRVRVSGSGTTVISDPVALTVGCGLVARLDGKAFYDACQNLTWIADASLPATLPLGVAGVGSDGTMTWPVAKTWIAALNGAAYLGYADWRLPTVGPANGTNFQLVGTELQGRTGQLDIGHNISAPGSLYAGTLASEFPFLYYNVLGGLARYALDGTQRPSWGSDGQPFANVSKTSAYWTGTAYGSTGAYAFGFDEGTQYAYVADAGGWHFSVLAVREGDVAATPGGGGGGGVAGVPNTCQPMTALPAGTVVEGDTATGGFVASARMTVVGPATFEGRAVTEVDLATASLGFDFNVRTFTGWNAAAGLHTIYGAISRASASGGANVQDVKAVSTPPTVDGRYALAPGGSITVVASDVQTETLTISGVPQAPTTTTETTTTTIQFAGIETVTVPAGTFRACKYVETDAQGSTTRWTMAGYGIDVKTVSAGATSVLTALRVNGTALTAFP